jgi:hypothetical protein
VTTNASSANPAWSPVSAVPFLNTQRVAFDSADPGTLYVTTHGGGAWRTMKPSTAAAWQQRIRRSAYDLYLRRGDSPGSALDDWVAAERLVLDDAVQRRAYERYLHRGRAAGGDLDDWLGAEREIRSSLR